MYANARISLQHRAVPLAKNIPLEHKYFHNDTYIYTSPNLNIYTHIHIYVLSPPPYVFLFAKPDSHYYPCSLSVLPPLLMPPIILEGPIYLSWDSADIQARAVQSNKERGTASEKPARK